MRTVLDELDDGENEVVGLVERIENLVPGHRECAGACVPALDLDEAQVPGPAVPALDVVTQLLVLPIDGLEPQRALHLHDDGAGTCCRSLRVGRGLRCSQSTAR